MATNCYRVAGMPRKLVGMIEEHTLTYADRPHGPSTATISKSGQASVAITDDGSSLRIAFTGGDAFEIAAKLLWRECPSAAGRRRRIDGRDHLVPPDLRLMRVVPIGNYAINLTFSDGHDRGVYPWDYLTKLARRPTVENFIMSEPEAENDSAWRGQ